MEYTPKGNIPPKGFVTPEKAKAQAEVLANSVTKRFRHLSRRFRRQDIDCFRLYDWDSPDIRIVVDWYAGHIVVAEYQRIQTTAEYLPQMADAAGRALGVPPEKIHIKRRHTNVEDGPRYERMDRRGELLEVRERNLRFLVNLNDFLDTGLFSDHRDTRVIIAKIARGKDFLNLFGYTGAFTCAAASGGAKSTITVDRSKAYIDWTKENLALNGLLSPGNKLIQMDVPGYLSQARKRKEEFSLVFVDPPSFYKSNDGQISFDVNRDHPELLRDTLKIMGPGSDLFFSTNHQRFEPKFEDLAVKDIIKLPLTTIPEDYRNKNVHNCWHMKV